MIFFRDETNKSRKRKLSENNDVECFSTPIESQFRMFNEEMLILTKQSEFILIRVYKNNLLEKNLVTERLNQISKSCRKVVKCFSSENRENDSLNSVIEWRSANKGINELVNLAMKIDSCKLPQNYIFSCFDLFKLNEVNIFFIYFIFFLYFLDGKNKKNYFFV